jgi:hypothetical protein
VRPRKKKKNFHGCFSTDHVQEATTPGIPRTPRSRRPVRLAVTAVPKITLTPGNRKTPQILSPNFP